MAKVTANDFDFFARLDCLYCAMALSATAPVSIQVDQSKGLVSAFSHVFYDCIEDEDLALRTMRRRFAKEADIRKHYKIHKRVLEHFYDLEDIMNHGTRSAITRKTDDLIRSLREYSNLVSRHKLILNNFSFLFYPVYDLGDIFCIEGDTKQYNRFFNKSQTCDEMVSELTLLRKSSGRCAIGKSHLQSFKFSNGEDQGEGIIDNSLRSRLELNKELLERAGFIV